MIATEKILGMAALSFGCGVFTYVAMPYWMTASKRLGLVDSPNPRKIHSSPIPCSGGPVLLCCIIVAFSVIFAWELLDRTALTSSGDLWKSLSLLAGCIWIAGVGFIDDRRGLSWSGKLAGQAAAVIVLAVGGHTIATVYLPVLGPVDFGWVGYVLFGFLVLGITNAINLIDGLDGLAAGICLFAALAGGSIALLKGDASAATIQFVLAGTLLGFLPYNSPPARAFLGDGGSMLLGLLLGTLALSSAAVEYPGQRAAVFPTLVAPLLPFLIGLLDVVLAVVRRFVRGGRIYLPDKDHIHHRLASEFRDVSKVNLILYTLSACFAVISVLLAIPEGSTVTRCLPFATAVPLVFLTGLLLRVYRIDRISRVTRAFAERPHFQFLDVFRDYMYARVQRQDSVDAVLNLAARGVTDLNFDRVTVYRKGFEIRSWTCDRPLHPDAPRMVVVRELPAADCWVEAVIPRHNRQSYQDALVLAWTDFIEIAAERLKKCRDANISEMASVETTDVRPRKASSG